MKKLIAGNWKMNGERRFARALIADIGEGLTPDIMAACDLLVCPPYPYLDMMTRRSAGIALGAQNCSSYDDGAYTGDVSAQMLRDIGCTYVILGHSERRQFFAETDAGVRAKAEKANGQGLIAIICVGETEAEREQGIQEQVVAAQLKGSLPENYAETNIVIAYEPVWAIGTGRTATADDIAAMHEFIRAQIGNDKIRILYGGSMKPANAAEILATPNVDGGLIGGASLKAEDFLSIAKAA